MKTRVMGTRRLKLTAVLLRDYCCLEFIASLDFVFPQRLQSYIWNLLLVGYFKKITSYFVCVRELDSIVIQLNLVG